MNKIKQLAYGIVCALAALTSLADGWPSGYTRCEYLQGDGSSGYLLTDFYPNPQTDAIVIEMSLPAQAGTKAVFACRASNGYSWSLFRTINGWRFDYYTTTDKAQQPSKRDTNFELDEIITVVVATNEFFTSSGCTMSVNTYSDFTQTGGPLILFASGGSSIGNYLRYNLYSLKVYREGVLIHDFVPALDDQDQPTLWDACGGTVQVEPHGTISYELASWDANIMEIPVQPYVGGQDCEPHPVVTDGSTGVVLREGIDYTLSWSSNDRVGVGTVYVDGLDVFVGLRKTATFAIVAKLPSSYKTVEWIRSSDTQYIDTGFMPDPSTCADFRFDMEAFAGNIAVPFGSRNGATCQFMPLAFGSNANGYWSARVGDKEFNYTKGAPAVVGEHVFSLNGATFSLDEIQNTVTGYTDFSKSYNAYVFALNNNNSATWYSPMKLYYLKIWDDGTLVRDFVPCVNKAGVAGLYDMTPGASKVFYTNDGTGEFEAGPVLEPESRTGTAIYLI